MISWKDFHDRVERYLHDYPTSRRGQAIFRVAEDVSPDFIDRIIGGPCDPFYSDRAIPAFYGEAWTYGFFTYE